MTNFKIKYFITVVFISLILNNKTFAQKNKDMNWSAGVSHITITPQHPLWMAGYASRSHPSVGKITDLHAKALALEDALGKCAVLITMDLVGIPKKVSDHIREVLKSKLGLSRSQIILNTSHTHTGPVLTGALVDIYPYNSNEQQKIDLYTKRLGEKIVKLAINSFQKMEPVSLYSGNGVARFQVNRRNNEEATLARQVHLNGPNDYSVPVIKVVRKDGTLMAVAFGYACHNTTLSGYKWSGDYAGFAQIVLEKQNPGVTALFFQGCGADQNPLPRRSISLAKQYGKTLAAAVETIIHGEMHELTPHLATAYKEIELPLNSPPSKEELTKRVKNSSGYQKRWASRLLRKLEEGQSLRTSYPYPVEVWKLGEQSMVILGGEVVVKYAIDLKYIFGQDLFVLGYSNDVMSYIPTSKILREGGYEGALAPMVYGLPATWRSDIQPRIITTVVDLAEKVGISIPTRKIE